MENIDDSESSNLIALTLGKAMNTEIKHIAYCYIRKKVDKNKPGKSPNVPVISCLGKDSIFIFRENFQKVFLKFPYSKIDHVVIEHLNKYTLMIVFNQERDFFYEGSLANDCQTAKNGSLPYIHLTIPDRNYFIENLMCYYSVHHISEKKIVKELIVKAKDKFVFNIGPNSKNEYKKLYNKPPSECKTLVNVNYIFYCPEKSLNNFEQSGIMGGPKEKYLNEIVYEFDYSDNSSSIGGTGFEGDKFNETSKQVERKIPIKAVITVKLLKLGNITSLDSIEISKEKNYITNTQHILQLQAYEQFRIKYYEKIKKNKIIILKDDKYLKKYNLSNDTSEWEGRAIKGFDLETCTLLHFFYIRRKYIPPFCDKYQDFLISCDQNLNIFEQYFSTEELEAKRINYILSENFKLNKNLELFINSIHNTDDNRVSHYTEILHFLYDTLSLDYNSLQYFTSSVEIIGKDIYLIGLKFVYFLLKQILNLKNSIKEQEKESGLANRRSSNTPINTITNTESEGNTQQNTYFNAKNMQNIIPTSIDDFLERIDFLMNLYAKRHDELLKEKIKENNEKGNPKEKRFKSLKDSSIDMTLMKWVFKEIHEEFLKHTQSAYHNDFHSLSKNWNIRIKKFLYFCLNGGLLPGTIDMGKLLDLMDYHIDYDRLILRDVVISLLFFDDRIDPSKFSLSAILSFGGDLVFNHELLCLIIEKGYIDIVFSTNDRSSVFSGEILTFLLQNVKSFEIMNAFYIYIYYLIVPKGKYPNKINVIIKQRQNIIKELFEVFRDENVNPYIIIKITMIFTALIYLESDQLKTITALVNKNIVDVIVNKLNSNNLNLILGLSSLLKALTNKIEASNVKSSFTKNIDSLIKNVTKLIQLNKYFRNSKLIDNLISIHINFLSKGNDSQKFYLIDIKNAADKQKSLVGTLMNLFYENVFSEENFVKSDAKMDELKSKFIADINILLFFQSLIKNNKQMKIAFKDKMELDFFCCGVNANANFSVVEPKNIPANINDELEAVNNNNLNTQNNKNAKNEINNNKNFFTSGVTTQANNNINNNNNNNLNLRNNINNRNNNILDLTKFNNKIKKLNNIIKNKIIIHSSDQNAFNSLVKKYRLDFIVTFYRLLSNIVEFCFYLLIDEDNDHKKSDNSSSYVFNLKELIASIDDLLNGTPHAMYHFDANDNFSKPALDRLSQAKDALNRYIEGQGEI